MQGKTWSVEEQAWGSLYVELRPASCGNMGPELMCARTHTHTFIISISLIMSV